jgi:hypothetical protein
MAKKVRTEIQRAKKSRRRQRPTVYSEICPHVFQSGQPTSPLPDGVCAVISVANAPPAAPFVAGLAAFVWLPFDDTPSARPTVEWLDTAVKLLLGWRTRNWGCLVHCKAGVSRSTLIIAAYLIKSQRLSAEDAIAWIKTRRPHIAPNIGFIQALIEYAVHITAEG